MLLEELLAELPGIRGRIGLCGKTLAPKKSRRLQADTLAVFRASPQGGRVVNGIVQLPSCSVLLLDGCGAHFERVTFTGGAVVCAGPGFRGSFRSCLFKDCNLYAVHGAAATLQRCALWCVQRALQLPAALRGPAVLASGTGTNVMLTDCVVVAFTHAAIADAGATVTAAATSAEHCTSGYIANGTGSHVALIGCALKGAQGGIHGVRVDGGSGLLRRCTVRGYAMALQAVSRGSTVEVHDSSLWATDSVVSITGGCVLLRDTAVVEPAAGADGDSDCLSAVRVGNASTPEGGATVTDPRWAQLERCSISHRSKSSRLRSCVEPVHASLCAAHGAVVAMHLCRVETLAVPEATGSDPRFAVAATEGGRLCMAHCHVASSGNCTVTEDSVLRAAACRLEMLDTSASLRVSASSVTLVDTCIVESGALPRGGRGMMVATVGATLRLLRTTTACSRNFASVIDSTVTAVGCSALKLQRPNEDHPTSNSGPGTSALQPALICHDSAVELRGGARVFKGFSVGVSFTCGQGPPRDHR